MDLSYYQPVRRTDALFPKSALCSLHSLRKREAGAQRTLKERALGSLRTAGMRKRATYPLSPAAYINYRSYCAKQSFDAMIDDILNRLTERRTDHGNHQAARQQLQNNGSA
ncbi:MAG: hypothetical protein ACLSGI_09590 [Butyricicoccaceae bacterium]